MRNNYSDKKDGPKGEQVENYRDKNMREYEEGLKKGYFRTVGGKRCMKPEMIVEYPKKMAFILQDKNRNKLSQLWKFYSYVKQIQSHVKHGKAFELAEPDLCEICPKVNNAYNRGNVTRYFKDFIEDNVRMVKSAEDLDAFARHFEAVIAYLPRKNQK